MTSDEFKEKLENVEKGIDEINLLNSYSWKICRVQTQEAFDLAMEAFSKSKELNYEQGLAESYRTIGNCYLLFGDYTRCIIEIESSLNLFKKIGDRSGEAEVLNLYGIVYSSMGNYTLAVSHFEISLEIMRDIGSNEGVVKAMNSIGDSLIKDKKYRKALRIFEETIRIEHHNEIYKGIVLYNISEVHYHLNNFDKAQHYLSDCKKIGRALKFELMFVYCSWLQGRIEVKRHNYSAAEKVFKRALSLAKRIKAKDRIFNILKDLAALYEEKGDLRISLKYYKEYLATKEEVINEESSKIIKTLEHKNELVVLKRETELEKIKNVELKKAYTLIDEKRKEISEKNTEITDSIRYAKRIQEAILPTDAYVKELLPDSFIFYQPKDILSGDFYWVSKVITRTNENLVVIAVVDCTGHGVPGALLSIVGSNFLRLCEVDPSVNSPAEALDFLNEGVCNTLRQTTEESSIKDGMDISYLVIDQQKMKGYFAGAKNALYLVRGQEITVVKGDRHPIGSFLGEKLKPFTNHEFDLQKNDQLYMFTDGLADQFGGAQGKKFKNNTLKELLLSYSGLPMEKQKGLIVKEFENWKGELEQVDDVCVFGMRVI
jgi:serine phosphatase RsbU (regulator of sigma subunit)